MKNLGDLMKQAQQLQEKMEAAKARMAETEVEGTSGGGMVSVTLRNVGELTRLVVDPSLLAPGEAEILTDLILAAHADARRKLEAKQQDIMRDAAGMFAGMPGLPTF